MLNTSVSLTSLDSHISKRLGIGMEYGLATCWQFVDPVTSLTSLDSHISKRLGIGMEYGLARDWLLLNSEPPEAVIFLALGYLVENTR